MMRRKFFFGFLFFILLAPLASISDATLWDLIIIANVENSPLNSGDRPIVTGVVLDQASKPVSNVEINVKSGSLSINTKTSQSGEFMAELGTQERLPGNYIVNISAETSDGKTGIASIQFQVKGEISPSAVNQQKLSTPEAKKYLNSSPEDFEGNPVGFMLYNYYQKLYQEFLKQDKIAKEISQKKEILNEQKQIAEKLRLEAIKEFNPTIGIFSGQKYEDYINSLDEVAKKTVVEHLNFTKNLVEEAQKVKNEILENGGTQDEAQAAYLEKITTSREMIENYGNEQNATSKKIENLKKEVNEESFLEIRENNTAIQVNVDGINVEVDFKESIFFVNVNGTLLQFFINGTNFTQINNLN